MISGGRVVEAACASRFGTGGAATRNASIAVNAMGGPSKNHNPRHRKVIKHCTKISSHTVAGTYLYAPQCAATGTSNAMPAIRGDKVISAKNKIPNVLGASAEVLERDVTYAPDDSRFGW